MAKDFSKKNRKFADEYELKNDGSLADLFMKNLKKSYVERDNMSEDEKLRCLNHYNKKMAQLIDLAQPNSEA
jgi:hypothetical protein